MPKLDITISDAAAEAIQTFIDEADAGARDSVDRQNARIDAQNANRPEAVAEVPRVEYPTKETVQDYVQRLVSDNEPNWINIMRSKVTQRAQDAVAVLPTAEGVKALGALGVQVSPTMLDAISHDTRTAKEAETAAAQPETPAEATPAAARATK